MAIISIDSGNHGAFSTSGGIYSVVGATPGRDTTTVRAGEPCSVLFDTINEYLRRTALAFGTISLGSAARMPSLPASTAQSICMATDGSTIVELRVRSDGKLAIWVGGSEYTASASAVISAATWYWLALFVDMSTNPWRIKAAVDETEVISTTVGLTGTSPSIYGWGNATSDAVNQSCMVAAIDHTPELLPKYKIRAFLPNGVGSHNLDASPSAHFEKIVSGSPTALTSAETDSWQTMDDVPIFADEDGVQVKAGGTATQYIDPDGNGTATAWTGTYTSVDDGTRQPTTPASDAITSGTDEASETLTFGTGTYVSGGTYRLWVYGGAGAKRAIDVAYSVNGSDPGTGHASRAELTRDATLQWHSRDLTIASQAELDALRVQLICNATAGGGGAGIADVRCVYLEIPGSETQPSNLLYAEYNVADTTDGDPIAVSGVATLKVASGTGSNSITVKAEIGATSNNIANGASVGSANSFQKATWGVSPSQTDFNAAKVRFGFTNDASPAPKMIAFQLEAIFSDSGPAPVTFAASPAGAASVAVANAVTRALSAAAAGVAAVQAAIARLRSVGAAASGQATVSADVTRTRAVSTPVQGAATVDVALTVTAGGGLVTFDAAVSGQATVAAGLGRTLPLSSAITGQTSVALALARSRPLDSTVAGQASVSSVFARQRALEAAVTGQAGITAAFARLVSLSAEVAPSVILSGEGIVGGFLVGETTGGAIVLVDLDVTPAGGGLVTFTASVAGQASVAVPLSGIRALVVPVSGAGTIAASSLRTRGLSASVAGQASVAAALVRLLSLAASPHGVATVAVAQARVRELQAAVAAAGNVSVSILTLGSLVTFAASVTGQATLTVAAGPIRGVSASVAGQATVAAVNAARRGMAASVAGQASIGVVLGRRMPLAAAVTGQANIVAALSRIIPPLLIPSVCDDVTLVAAVEDALTLNGISCDDVTLTVATLEDDLPLVSAACDTMVLVAGETEES